MNTNIDGKELARVLAVQRALAKHDLVRRLGECRAEWLLDQVVEHEEQEIPEPLPVVHCFVDNGR
jgi:hypothetical protein